MDCGAKSREQILWLLWRDILELFLASWSREPADRTSCHLWLWFKLHCCICMSYPSKTAPLYMLPTKQCCPRTAGVFMDCAACWGQPVVSEVLRSNTRGIRLDVNSADLPVNHLKQLWADDTAKDTSVIWPCSAPHLFVSRPNGWPSSHGTSSVQLLLLFFWSDILIIVMYSHDSVQYLLIYYMQYVLNVFLWTSECNVSNNRITITLQARIIQKHTK